MTPDLPVSASRRPLAGSAVLWARDLALVGGVSGALAPLCVIGDVGFAAAAGITGAALGALMGRATPRLLEVLRRTVPLSLMVLAAPMVGGVWGGLSGLVGGAFAGGSFSDGSGMVLGLVFGALAGAMQLGWMWLPYTVQSVRGGWRWPLLGMACLMAPALGWASLVAFLVMITPAIAVLVLGGGPVVVLSLLVLESSVRSARELEVGRRQHAAAALGLSLG